MIGWERRMLLRHYLEQGMSKSAIAEQLGIGRRTIYHWIETGQLDRDVDAEAVRYKPRPPVTTKLAPYEDYIRGRLEDFPKLTAVRLFEEVQAAGYPGGYTQVKEFVRRARPRPPVEEVQRFETPPGRQGQVDFAHARLPWGLRHGLVVTLGFSRLLWLQFYRRQDMRTLFEGLEAAFHFFGGVPEELLFDQMRSVITRDLRAEGGRLVENAEFLRFARHWGFRPRACRPYRARTKGKVERPIRYIRERFLYGRSFAGDADLNAQVLGWLEAVANVRLHRTTGERPVERFEREERHCLRPLAPRPYESLVLPLHRQEPRMRKMTEVPSIPIQRRPLSVYARVAGGER